MSSHDTSLFRWSFTSTELLLTAHICLSVRKIAQKVTDFDGIFRKGFKRADEELMVLDSRKTLTIDLPNR